jgi:hypothetical protein
MGPSVVINNPKRNVIGLRISFLPGSWKRDGRLVSRPTNRNQGYTSEYAKRWQFVPSSMASSPNSLTFY